MVEKTHGEIWASEVPREILLEVLSGPEYIWV